MTASRIEELEEDFSLLDEWEDRYRYVIELGKGLSPLDEADRNASTKVQGCVSQVWIRTDLRQRAGRPILTFKGDSDAHIVRGLIAILFLLFDGKPAAEIVTADAQGLLARLGLDEHLTPQRSNGLASMIRRIKSDAQAALAAQPA